MSDAVKYAFWILLVILSLGAGTTVYKVWRELDDKGEATRLFDKMIPNLAQLPADENPQNNDTPRGGDIAAIVESYRAAQAAEEEARRTGKPVAPATAVKAVPTPGADDRVITEWGTGRKMVALTYDDGPNPEFTPRLIGLLREKDAKATFFVLGQQVARGENIIRAAVSEGHEIGCHTWSHKQLSKLSGQALNDEVMKGVEAIRNVTGRTPCLVRPPYGAQNKTVREFAKANNLYLINWSVDTNDWRSSTKAADIINEADKKAYDGCIILMHDRLERTIEATGQVIDILRAKGYRFVTVSQLLGLDDPDNPAKYDLPSQAEPTTATTSEPAAVQPESATDFHRDMETNMDTATTEPAEAALPPAMTPRPGTMLPVPQIPGVNYDRQEETAVPPNMQPPDLPADVITQPSHTVRRK